jgi:hypothetical protein
MRGLKGSLLTAMAVAGLCASVIFAPDVGAAPDCVQVGPNTTQCTTKGSTAITTSPPLNQWSNYGPLFYGGWGGGLVIGG